MSCTELHWSCMELHWSCMELHGVTLEFHGVAKSCTELQRVARSCKELQWSCKEMHGVAEELQRVAMELRIFLREIDENERKISLQLHCNSLQLRATPV